MSAQRRLLFVCVGNACRSQMAEGFAIFHGKDRVKVKSAGTSALGIVVDDTIEVMGERGIDISSQTSDQLTDEMIEWADIVVTLGCTPADMLCPESYEGEKFDWPVEDPIGRPMEETRRIRDDIERRVKELIDDQTRQSS